MKKSYIYIIAAFIVIISVVFTACGNSNIYVDQENYSHVIVTNEDKQPIQDKFGNLYEEVQDKDGNTVTQIVNYPTVSTNKNSSVMENAGVRMEVPRGWKNTGYSNVFRLHHMGKCVDIYNAPCEIELAIVKNHTQQEVHDENKNTVNYFMAKNNNVSDVKEYTAEICGKKALVASCHFDEEGYTSRYFSIQNGYIVVKITVLTYDECYDNDSVVELLNSCLTFKDLGPDYVPETEASASDLSTTVTE